MPQQAPSITLLEMIDDYPLDTHALARCCHRSIEWVHARVSEGVLSPSDTNATHSDSAATWRFTSTTIVRARRVAQLEQMYDADPQLAAMTVDLMEEVLMLRRQLQTHIR